VREDKKGVVASKKLLDQEGCIEENRAVQKEQGNFILSFLFSFSTLNNLSDFFYDFSRKQKRYIYIYFFFISNKNLNIQQNWMMTKIKIE